MGDAALALMVGVILAGVVAFRRARGVLTPEARRVAARRGWRERTRQATFTVLALARAAAGIAAFAGVIWLARQLFT